jgi:hypothetical protein
MPAIEFPKTRKINEVELRVWGLLSMMTLQYARRTVATWLVRRKKPTKDEMQNLVNLAVLVEESILRMAKGATDPRELDGLIQTVTENLKALDEKVRKLRC